MILPERLAETMVLQPICPDGRHQFAPQENNVAAGCGWAKGADIADDLVVVSIPPRRGYLPQPGDICQICFQVLGQSRGSRDLQLATAYHILVSTNEPSRYPVRRSQ